MSSLFICPGCGADIAGCQFICANCEAEAREVLAIRKANQDRGEPVDGYGVQTMANYDKFWEAK